MSQIGHTFGVTGTNLFLFLFGNPARNGSKSRSDPDSKQVLYQSHSMCDAGRRTKFDPVKSLDSSELRAVPSRISNRFYTSHIQCVTPVAGLNLIR